MICEVTPNPGFQESGIFVCFAWVWFCVFTFFFSRINSQFFRVFFKISSGTKPLMFSNPHLTGRSRTWYSQYKKWTTADSRVSAHFGRVLQIPSPPRAHIHLLLFWEDPIICFPSLRTAMEVTNVQSEEGLLVRNIHPPESSTLLQLLPKHCLSAEH